MLNQDRKESEKATEVKSLAPTPFLLFKGVKNGAKNKVT